MTKTPGKNISDIPADQCQLSDTGLFPETNGLIVDGLSATGEFEPYNVFFDFVNQLNSNDMFGNSIVNLPTMKVNEQQHLSELQATEEQALPTIQIRNNQELHNELMQEAYIAQQPNETASVSKTLASSHDYTRPSNVEIADWLIVNFRFVIINDVLYVYDNHAGYFRELSTGNKADHFIRSVVPDEIKNYISNYTNREIFQWLMSKEDLHVSTEMLKLRKSYVLYKNCVVNVTSGRIIDFSPEHYFTSRINANYFNDEQDGYEFECFISTITQDDSNLYDRLQELFGYVTSQERDLKVIPYLIGPKDSGKSIILKLLTHLIGEDFTSEISMDEFNDERYLNQLVGKRLNVCAEITEIPLKKLDTLKKLSGGDALLVRKLYDDAKKFRNEAVLIFAGNDLPFIKRGHDRSNAFFERLLLFPFQYQVPKEEQDLNLYNKLLNETDYIAKWALEGLQRLYKNNFNFTPCDTEVEIMEHYLADHSHSSIDKFISDNCELSPNFKSFSIDLFLAYENYCDQNHIIPNSSKEFYYYLQSAYNLTHKRARIENSNRQAFIGIRLCKEDQNSTNHHIHSDEDSPDGYEGLREKARKMNSNYEEDRMSW